MIESSENLNSISVGCLLGSVSYNRTTSDLILFLGIAPSVGVGPVGVEGAIGADAVINIKKKEINSAGVKFRVGVDAAAAGMSGNFRRNIVKSVNESTLSASLLGIKSTQTITE